MPSNATLSLSEDAHTPQSLQPNYTEQSKSLMEQVAAAQEQSRYAIAVRFPRDIEVVRQNMLRECSRPEFVMPDSSKNGSSVAWYKLPKAGGIEGFTVRFAEMARQAWGHTFINIMPMGEDEIQRIFQVNCTDYQTNNGASEIVIMSKSVERSKIASTDTVLGQRTNSKGYAVYTVIGTDDDLLAKKNSLCSKAKRNLILELIPGWLKEECKDRMIETARKKDAEDPDAAKRKIFDGFLTVGVTAEMLNEYIGHTNQLQPAELADLRGYFSSIREGHTTWAEIAASKDDQKDSTVSKEIDKLLAESGRKAAVARNLRASYAGRPDELLKFLQDEAKKKADTGAAPQTDQKQEQSKEIPGFTPGTLGPTNFPMPGTPVDPNVTLPGKPSENLEKLTPKKQTPPPPPPVDENW